MAISAVHYRVLTSLQPQLPVGGSLLEIGEANWYGDIDPQCLLEGVTDDALKAAIADAVNSGDPFAIAKAYYAKLFQPRRVVSVDTGGTATALKYDLNKPLPPLGQFNVIINNGTAEHVFNIAQVFASIHAACKPGGWMVHDAPFFGWVDHGFYCLQPTLFYDLAAANGYGIECVFVGDLNTGSAVRLESRDAVAELAQGGRLADNAILMAVLRKTTNEPFRLPWQGYYAQTLSEAGRKAWEELR